MSELQITSAMTAQMKVSGRNRWHVLTRLGKLVSDIFRILFILLLFSFAFSPKANSIITRSFTSLSCVYPGVGKISYCIRFPTNFTPHLSFLFARLQEELISHLPRIAHNHESTFIFLHFLALSHSIMCLEAGPLDFCGSPVGVAHQDGCCFGNGE